MGNQHIRARLGHRPGLVGVEDIRAGEHLQLAGLTDHLHLQPIAHPRLFQIGPHHPVDQPDRWKVLHPVEAHTLQLAQEVGHQPEGVGAAYARQHRCIHHHRQHFPRHLHDNRVGIAVGHHPGQAAPPGHAIAPGIVDDNQVHPAPFAELGGDACARARADNRAARSHFGAQATQGFSARNVGHGVLL